MPINIQDIQDFNELKNLYFSKKSWDLEIYTSFYKDLQLYLNSINYIGNVKSSLFNESEDWKIKNIIELFTNSYYIDNDKFIIGGCGVVIIERLFKVKNKVAFEYLFTLFSAQNFSKSKLINPLQFLILINKIDIEDFETLSFSLAVKHSVDIKLKLNIDYLYELYKIGRDYLYNYFFETVWFWIELDIKKFLNNKQKVERFLQEYKHITQNFREIDLNQSIDNYVKVKNQNRIEENVLTRDIGNFLSNQGFRDLRFEAKTTSVAKGHGRCDIISQNNNFIIESKYNKESNVLVEIKDAINQGANYCKDHSIKNLYIIVFISDISKANLIGDNSGTQDGINYTVYCVDIRLEKNPPSKKIKTPK